MKITIAKIADPGPVRLGDIRMGWFTAHFDDENVGLYFKDSSGHLFMVNPGCDTPFDTTKTPSTQIYNYTPVEVEIIVRPKK